jgi:meromycolic acid enoyl-[acyl-carrier-protein] reductase
MGILDGKKLLITGVVTDDSLAFQAAKQAQDHGAEIVLSGAGRALSLTKRIARKLPVEPEVIELDVTLPEHLQAAHETLDQKWGRLDGILHAIAFAPSTCLSENFFDASWDDVATALHVSMYSFSSLTEALLPLFQKAGGGSVVGLDFDAQVTWPIYNWMGVAKAGLEATSRYLARQLGPQNIRFNLISAGPIYTIAGKSIPRFDEMATHISSNAPLGWDARSAESVGRSCVALFSDLMAATTGEIIHVDGGYHIIGA